MNEPADAPVMPAPAGSACSSAPSLPPCDGCGTLDYVYVSAGVVRDLAMGFGEGNPYPSIATGVGPAPCSER